MGLGTGGDMEESVYVIFDGRDDVVAVCDPDGIVRAITERTRRLTSDIAIDLRLDDPEPKAVVCLYASDPDHWNYSYRIRRMPLVRGSLAR
jgi:hypothetical protein